VTTNPPRRTLIVKTSSLGDVVHALPALTDIKRHCPEVSVDWLVEEAFADIPRLHPAVERVARCALRRWRHNFFSAATWREIRALRFDLRQKDYDVVLDLQGLLKSAWLARLAHGTRHGYDAASIREPLASCLYSVRHTVSQRVHAITRNRLLAAAAFGYELSGEVDYGLTHASFAVSTAPTLLCFHGTSRADKLWPEAHWQAVLAHFAARGVRVLLPWGSVEEGRRSDRLAEGLNGVEVLPPQGLTALARWCAGAIGVIGVDTGLTHLAAAAGAPVIALYCASDPALTGVVGGRAPARNLGGVGKPPDAETVLTVAAEIFKR
jgi:heptosyltransferase I